MEKQEKFFCTKNIVYLAILTTLLVVLNLLGTVFKIITNVNLTLIPIVLGALLLGWRGGLILGLISGVMTYLFGVFAIDIFTNILFVNHPVLTFLVCTIKTTLAGVIGGLVYGILKKKNQYVATFVASGVVPVVNTAIFILGALTMYNTLSQEFSSNVMYFLVIDCAGINFLIEFAINLVVAPAIYTVVKVLEKTAFKGR
ncbi:MAG: ECF transporter S component [Clostridia bacterium]|nr:ECF transporter S component [Clostridia bacterium]